MLQSVIQFWAGIFVFLLGLIATIEKICKDFLWSCGSFSREKVSLAWQNVCFLEEQGGLDICEVLAWNKILMFQRLWDAFIPGSVWGNGFYIIG